MMMMINANSLIVTTFNSCNSRVSKQKECITRKIIKTAKRWK